MSYVFRSCHASLEKNTVSILACLEIPISIFLIYVFYLFTGIAHVLFLPSLLAPLFLLESARSKTISQRIVDNSEKREFGKSAIVQFSLMLAISIVCIFIWSFVFVMIEGYFYDYKYLFLAIFGYAFIEIPFRVTEGIFEATFQRNFWKHEKVMYVTCFVSPCFASLFFQEPLWTIGAISGGVIALMILRLIPLGNFICSFYLSITTAAGDFLYQWIRAFFVRLYSNIYAIREGFQEIGQNWRRQLFVRDVFTPSELIPGVDTSVQYSDYGSIQDISTGFPDPLRVLSASGKYFANGILVQLYRLLFKSTFLIYWPLIFSSSGRIELESREQFILRLTDHPFEKLVVGLSVLSLLALLVLSVSPSALIDVFRQNPALPHAYILAVNVSELKYWHYIQLALSVSTIFVWIKISSMSIRKKALERAGKNFDWAGFSALERYYDIRNAFSLIYGVLALMFMVSFVPEICMLLPADIVSVLKAMFYMSNECDW